MVHPGVDVVGIQHDLMAGYTFYVGHKTDATRIFFICGVVKALFLRQLARSYNLIVYHRGFSQIYASV